jgi:orotidine-5'-phosphate decarboxylase
VFSDRLIEKIIEKSNPSVLGLDPRLELIPGCIRAGLGDTTQDVGAAVFRFNRALIDAVAEIMPAVKLQIAFYEALGIDGLKAYQNTLEYACSKGLIVIGDIKRGDISSTAAAYKYAHFDGPFACDAVTLNPFLGYDAVLPFIRACEEQDKGVFILVKTSNPSSGDLQNMMVDGDYLYKHLGRMVAAWGKSAVGTHGYSSVGAVVGATYPKEMAVLRKEMPGALFLVPGYGAQGGSGREVANAFNKDGLGAIINSSRAIMGAYMKTEKGPEVTLEEFRQAAHNEAVRMKKDITAALRQFL